MKWTEYPDREAFRQDQGREVQGQYVSPAPGGKWAITPGKVMHLVKFFHGDAYCIAEEDPR